MAVRIGGYFMKKCQVSRRVQRVVADILVQLLACEDLDDVVEVVKKTYDDYMLMDDPFTGLPCSCFDYSQLSLEYDKQMMIDKYGHCDGLE